MTRAHFHSLGSYRESVCQTSLEECKLGTPRFCSIVRGAKVRALVHSSADGGVKPARKGTRMPFGGMRRSLKLDVLGEKLWLCKTNGRQGRAKEISIMWQAPFRAHLLPTMDKAAQEASPPSEASLIWKRTAWPTRSVC